MARKKINRLSILSQKFKEYNATAKVKMSWPPTRESAKILLGDEEIKPTPISSRRGLLFREAKNLGFTKKYNTSTIKKLEKFINKSNKINSILKNIETQDGPFDISFLIHSKKQFHKFLMQIPHSKFLATTKNKFILKLDDRFITLTDIFYKKFNKHSEDFDAFISDLKENNSFGSDVDYVLANLNTFSTASILKIKGDEIFEGAFFPYKLNYALENNPNFQEAEAYYIRYGSKIDIGLDCLGHAIMQIYPEKKETYLTYRKHEPGTYMQRNRLSKLAKALSLNITYRVSCGELDVEGKQTGKSKSSEHTYKSKPSHPTIKITSLNNHYFLFEETTFTSKMINKLAGNKIDNCRPNPKLVTSFTLMRQMIMKKIVLPFTAQEILDSETSFKMKLPNISSRTPNLVENNTLSQPEEAEGRRHKEFIPIYFDTETYVDENGIFQIYQLCFSVPVRLIGIDKNKVKYRCFCIDKNNGGNSENEILEIFFNRIHKYHNSFPDHANSYICCIAHNLGFDLASIMRWNNKDFKISSRIGMSKKNTKAMSTFFRGSFIKFQDSMAFLDTSLDAFTKMFNLETKKGPFPYNAMSPEVVKSGFVKTVEALKHIKQNQQEEFLEAVEGFYTDVDKEYINILKYSEYYCKLDVKLLQEGFSCFRDIVDKQYGIEALHFISTPSLAKSVLLGNKWFQKTKEVKGILREYINKTCVGGRTMTRNNEKQNVEDLKIVDFDVTSLYPYAFTFLTNVPTSDAQTIKLVSSSKLYTSVDTLYKDIDLPSNTWIFIDINIINVEKPREIASLSTINEETGTRNWTDKPGKYTVNSIQLEDLCKFQKITYEFHGGVYFPSSDDDVSFKDFFENLFSARNMYKNEGNPLQLVFKLLMNCIHGKMTQNPIKSTEIFKESYNCKNGSLGCVFEKFLAHNYQAIEEFYALPSLDPTCKQTRYLIKKTRAVGDFSNQCHIASYMYAYSKRVMNEVIYILEDNNAKVYYTDTDSIFFEQKHLEFLEKEYYRQYNRNLSGKGLGYFHSDFEVPESIDSDTYASGKFYGKKSYFLQCHYTDKITNERAIKNIEKMKGIPQSSIKEYYRSSGDDHITLRNKLYNGETINFDLSTNQVRFEINKSFQYSNNTKFIRSVVF